MRERVAGIDGERRHHGQEPALEVVQEIAGLLGRLLPRADQADPMGFEARDERLDEEPVLLLDEVVDPGGDGQHGLARGEPVGSDRAVARGDLALEPGHPDHVVLVQIRAEDGEELDALEERHRLVLGLLEHPAIELEPGQLAVDERGVVRRHRVRAERLAEEQAVANPARGDDHREVAAVHQRLLDDDGAGDDGVDALRLEPAEAPSLPHRSGLEPRPDGRDVGLSDPHAVAVPPPAPVLGEVHPGEGADGAAEADHLVAAPGRGEGVVEPRADLGAEQAQLARLRGIPVEEGPRHAHRADGHARRSRDAPAAHGRELQAAAAEIGDHAVELRHVLDGRARAEARLLGPAQHAHLDALLAAERAQQALAVLGLADGGRGDRDDLERPLVPGVRMLAADVTQEPPDGPQRVVDRGGRQGARPPAAEPRLASLLPQHAEARPRLDPGEHEAHGVRPEVQQRDELRHPQSCQACAPPSMPASLSMKVMSGFGSNVRRLALPPPT